MKYNVMKAGRWVGVFTYLDLDADPEGLRLGDVFGFDEFDPDAEAEIRELIAETDTSGLSVTSVVSEETTTPVKPGEFFFWLLRFKEKLHEAGYVLTNRDHFDPTED